MKNIRLLFILAIGFIPVCLWAKPVSPETAKQVAEAQVRSQIQFRSAQIPELNLVYVETTGSKTIGAPSDVVYYVFNAGNQGFVIVSGDDIAVPVLGYSDEGAYDPENLPPNFVYYLGCLADEINWAITNNLPQSEKAKEQWEALLSGTVATLRAATSVSPMLDIEGIKWNQGAPYNNECPLDGTSRSVTGCAATAMAQIMRYHKYPAKGNGIIPEYFAAKLGVNIGPVNIDNHYYIWENMLPQYSSPTSGTTEQRAAVAYLMYHCGASAQMNYSAAESGATTRNIGIGLLNHFDYDQSMLLKRRAFYLNSDWENLLLEEINNGRPVYYAGYNTYNGSTSGHAFVCDGYNDSGEFHFNWGWGGLYNGYFITTVLNPGTGGIGSGPGTYNEDQEIFINYKPNEGGKRGYEITSGSSPLFTSNKTQVNTLETFSVNASIFNNSLFSFSGIFGIALYTQTNQFVEVIATANISNLQPNYGYSSYPFSNSRVSSTVPSGDYVIKPIAISEFGDTIPVMFPPGSGSLPLKVIVPVTGVALDKTELGLGIGGSAQLTPIFTPAYPTNTSVTWLSSNTAIATVMNGLVTAVSKGQATITVKTDEGGYTATCIINVRDPAVITLNPVSGSISGDLHLYETSSGSGVVLPEAIPCHSDWTFAGWSKTPINTPTELADENTVSAGLIPAGLFVSAEETTTLYAVYKKYEDRGKKEKLALFADFNSGLPSGWQAPTTYYPSGGIGGSACRTFVNVGDVIVTPYINDPSRITFFVRRINYYDGTIIFSVQICKRDDDVWQTICTYPSNEIPLSWSSTPHECNFSLLNLTGEYRIRFILDNIGEGYSTNLGLDDVTIYNTFNDEGNTFTSIIEDCMPATIAWQGGTDTDWGNFLNWPGGRVPADQDIVTIPSNPINYFPILDEPIEVAEIHFAPGAQIGGQSNLTAKAFVSYDLSDNKRERWNMLSIPLGQVVPGDFVFGGYPTTWVRTFTTYTDGALTKGGWVTASGGSTAFSAGDGFVLWLNKDGENEPNKGLKRLNGILELPYFQNFEESSDDYSFYHDVNIAHTYNSGTGTGIGTSTFNNFTYNGSEYERGPQNYNVIRNSTAFEIAKGNVSKTPEFADGSFALMGNPFMAALDFDEFCKDPANSGTIKDIYHIWIDNAYKSYSSTYGYLGTDENLQLTKDIAPLQGFIVEKIEESPYPSPQFRYTEAPPELTFKDSWAKVNNDAVLRSSANAGNRLDIIARNPEAGVRTLIAQAEGGQDEFGNLDARKIINEISKVPEIYTLKPYQGNSVAVSINVINNGDLLIPVGLATSYSGNITLTFSGMESYSAAISLIDAETNRTIDLTGLASYEYAFNYTPKTINGEATVCEDRFFIRISKSATGLIETIVGKVNVFESNGLIRIVSGTANPVKEVSVFDLQGMLLYKEVALNAISHTVNKSFPAGAYIVKVVSEKNTENVKLIKR